MVVQFTEDDVEVDNGVWAQAVVLNPKVLLHNDGYFMVRFSRNDEKEEVLFKGPYNLFNRSVKLPNLPLKCWTGTTLNKVRSLLGKPLFIDVCTLNMEQTYTTLLVEINVTQQMKWKIKVQEPFGRALDQIMVYEWMPMYCAKCCHVSHVCKEENLLVNTPKRKKAWRKARELDPATNPLIDSKGRYKAQLVGEDKDG
ncbi:hypothetical protein H5410_021047 [Solanum commersonii]|uniref:DUF4283 domain-containing protein n=1 Tax=Solanum commersonii TaxID=4109 RepID=A0A9J5ZG13_SOLCO|nr:hypothetical protein H5410_021047 [Solanum commersonii]